MPVRGPNVARLKTWSGWEHGVGYPVDDGQKNGMHYSSGLLGLQGELRPAPYKTTVTIGIDEAHHYQYFFEEPLSNPNPAFVAGSATNTGAWNNGDSSQSATVSVNVGTGSNRLLVVWVILNNVTAQVAFSVSYLQGGTATQLTQFKTKTFGNLNIIMYYMTNPDSGANNLVVSKIAGTADVVILPAAFSSANQSAPLHSGFGDSGTGTDIDHNDIDSATTELMISAAMRAANTTIAKVAAQTYITQDKKNTDLDIVASSSYETGAASADLQYTAGASGGWVHVGAAVIGVSPGNGYLYAQRGSKTGNTFCAMEKIDLFNSSFATLEAGSHTLTNLRKCGQQTRYQGFWWLPDGDEFDPRKLTVGDGAVAADTLAASSAWTNGGADHLGNMNGQMIAGLMSNGYAILAVDGTPTTTANWGSYFPVGDKNERSAAIAGLQGLSFVLTVEGLFSFNSDTRSGLVFEDFRSWRNLFDNIPMPAWKGGLLIAHPTGLLYYTPGEQPINIGVSYSDDGRSLTPSGVPELQSGRYMGVYATGDYIYAIYQPTVSSTSVLVQCGYTRTGDPQKVTWQTLCTTTLNDAQHLLGVFVAAQGQPLSSNYYTPTAWFGDGTDLSYVVLDARAGPFRSRADTHRVLASAEAYFSELIFEEPLDLTELVITTRDMASNDSWQLSAIVNTADDDVNIGEPIIKSGRHVRYLNRQQVSRVMLHVTWATSNTSSRVAPSIRQIELYGKLAESN